MSPAAARAEAPALRYVLRREDRGDVAIDVPGAAVTRVRLPDYDAKARLVRAVLDARCERNEQLELFGEDVARLRPAARAQLRRRVGVLTPLVPLISNLNVWENISLPAAYRGSPPLRQIAEAAQRTLAALGADPEWLFARLPDELGAFERKLVEFTRLMVGVPELAVFDAIGAGLDPGERACTERFEAEYLYRRPGGTLIYADLEEGRP